MRYNDIKDKSTIVGCFAIWIVRCSPLFLASTHGKDEVQRYSKKFRNYKHLHVFTSEDDAKQMYIKNQK